MSESYTPTGATAAAITRFTAAEAATGTFGSMHRTWQTEIADRTRFLATTGLIAFPATQVTSADANTLDDYEEGTFSPSITFGGGSNAQTGTFTGRYTKIGRMVQFQIHITLTAKGSSTGAAAVAILPFSVGSTNQGFAWMGTNVTAAGPNLLAYSNTSGAGAAALELYTIPSGGSATQLTHASFVDTSEVYISGCYNV